MIKGLLPGPRRRAFRAFVRALRDSPTFHNGRIVKTWMVGDSDKPDREPVVDQMPAVRLRLVGGPIERLAVTAEAAPGLASVDIRTQSMVLVETFVEGDNLDDAMDLYDAIDAALFPEDPARRAAIRVALREVGISDYWPERDVLPEQLADYAGAWIRSVGMYTLQLDLAQ